MAVVGRDGGRWAFVLAGAIGIAACSSGDANVATTEPIASDPSVSVPAAAPISSPDSTVAPGDEPDESTSPTTTELARSPVTTQPLVVAATLSADDSTLDPVGSSLRPTSYAEVVDFGVEAGLWTEADGVSRVLGYVSGSVPADQVPGVEDVGFPEISDLLARAVEFIASDTVDGDTLERLADAARPPVRGFRRATPICAEVYAEDFASWAGVEGCYRVIEQSTQGVRLRVFYPSWFDDEDGVFDLGENALQAMVASIDVYADVAAVGDVDLLFSPHNSPDSPGAGAVATVHEAWLDRSFAAGCPITMASQGALAGQDLLQIVAHEVWHCVQLADGYPKGVAPGSAWVYEGGAEYFSNLVYPTIDFEHRVLDDFDARSTSMPITALSYDAWVFWQHLANERSPEFVADIMRQLARDPSGDLTFIDDAGFHRFIVRFMAGAIRDESGEMLPRGRAIAVEPDYRVNATDEGRRLEFTAEPLVGARWAVRYNRQLRVVQTDETGTSGLTSMVASADRTDLDAWSGPIPEIRSTCDDRAVYIVVGANVSETHEPQLVIDTVEEAPCDPCVLGTWSIDLTTFEAMLAAAIEREGVPDGVTMSYSGDYFVQFEDGGVVKEQRDGLTISVSAPEGGVEFIVDSFAVGEFTADGDRLEMLDLVELFAEVTSDIPVFGNRTIPLGSSALENAGGEYVCGPDEMIAAADGFDPVRFVRVDKILEPPPGVDIPERDG